MPAVFTTVGAEDGEVGQEESLDVHREFVVSRLTDQTGNDLQDHCR